MMKILYFSDNYAHHVMGVKRSIYEELIRRKNGVKFQDKKEICNIVDIVNFCNPDQIWLTHSGLTIPEKVKRKIKVPIVGFGFSDPYYFKAENLKSYDVYVTNHWDTYLSIQEKFPVIYNPPACDLSFHKGLYVQRDIDISFIGIGRHIRFKNQNERFEIIDRLKKETNFRIEAWGRDWPNGHIEGEKFLEIINRSRVGLDIQEATSPLSHRMFEYSACGTPVITRERKGINDAFHPAREIITYTNYEDLKAKLIYYLDKNPEMLGKIGFHAQQRCREEHDIRHRMDKILLFLERILHN